MTGFLLSTAWHTGKHTQPVQLESHGPLKHTIVRHAIIKLAVAALVTTHMQLLHSEHKQFAHSLAQTCKHTLAGMGVIGVSQSSPPCSAWPSAVKLVSPLALPTDLLRTCCCCCFGCC